MKDKFYDQLRTKEALGYIVQMFAIEAEGYYGMVNVVQSNSKTPEYSAGRVRNFYKEVQQKNSDKIHEQMTIKNLNSQIEILETKLAFLKENH